MYGFKDSMSIFIFFCVRLILILRPSVKLIITCYKSAISFRESPLTFNHGPVEPVSKRNRLLWLQPDDEVQPDENVRSLSKWYDAMKASGRLQCPG